MIHSRLLATTLASTLLVSLPATALGQDEEISLQGTEWSLVAYYDEEAGEPATVPFDVNPTLQLQNGAASGFGGCNSFGLEYALDDSELIFSDELTSTNTFCEGPAQAVEDAYLAALGRIGSWSIDQSRLELYDNLGDLMLTFEVPGISWTPTQLAALLVALEDLRTEIDTLRDDTDSLNVPRLRERIKALEKENKSITRRLAELEGAPKLDPTPSPAKLSFNAAEKVLLKGIPPRIAGRCSPLRSQLPSGTLAAVTCRPNTQIVSSMDYYLLEGSRAITAFGTAMTDHKVPDAGAKSCVDGTKSQQLLVGNGWQAEGCYREDKKAQLRFVDNATNCRKLWVDEQRLESPALYVAVRGTGQDIARAYDWATKGLAGGSELLTSITEYIPSTAARSPACAS